MSDRMLTHELLSGAWFPVLLVAVAVVLCWMEYRRRSGFRTIRIVATLLVMAAIAGLFLQPSVKTGRSRTAVLLTDGYTSTQADSLLALNKDTQFYHLANAPAYRNSTHLKSIYAILPIANVIHFVLGHGLPEHAWEQFGETRPAYVPAPSLPGVSALASTDFLQNQVGKIYGTYKASAVPVTLSLQSPAGGEDSVTLTQAGTHTFELRFLPRQAGNFLYQLTIRNNAQIEHEDIPVVVREASPAKILFLQRQPTFETRYLKDYLSRHNHQVVLRYQLSKNIFRYEYAHHPPIAINNLSENILSDFDLVVLDEDILAGLSSAEIRALDNAVANGVGMLIMITSANGKNVSHFLPWKFTPAKTDTATLVLASKKITVSTAGVSAAPHAQLRPVLKNKNSVLTGYRTSGLGKIGYQLLQNTYPVVLQGDSLAYSRLWSPAIEVLLRTSLRDNSVYLNNNFPAYPGTSVDVDMVTTQNVPVLYSDNTHLPLAEDALLDDLWHTTLWTGEPGWHSLIAADSIRHDYFVSKPGAWKSLHAAALRNASMPYRLSASVKSSADFEYRSVPPLIFYLLLLAGLLVLWLTPKL